MRMSELRSGAPARVPTGPANQTTTSAIRPAPDGVESVADRALAAANRPDKVGTMGPLTCSAEALVVLLFLEGSATQPAYFPSFDAAVAALLGGDIDRVLLPHCHPFTNQLLFDERFEFEMRSGFDKRNPPIHLTRRPSADPVPSMLVGRCAAVPTLWPLVSDSAPNLTLVPAVSNPAAAKAVVDGNADYAITNEASLSAFGLASVRQLKEVIVRWFPVRLRRSPSHVKELRSPEGTRGESGDPRTTDQVSDPPGRAP